MTSALPYLLVMTWRNRLVTRFKRLKQPKYLFGAIVGGMYFYFYFFRWIFRARTGGSTTTGVFPNLDPVLIELLGAAIFCVFVFSAWIFPSKRAALTFSEAEIAFLFPAPISRRTLIHFKLLRSQLAILVTVLFLTLFAARSGSWLRAGIHAGGWWLVLSTLNLHFLGASLERTRLLDRGLTNWQRRCIVLGLVLGVVAWVLVWARRALPPLTPADFQSVQTVASYAESLLTSGPLPYLLAPVRLVVKPYLATDLSAFLLALGPAVLVLLVHYIWVVRTNVAFEEASIEASQKLAERVAAVRAGNWHSANQKRKPARVPFKLQPVGSPIIALLWKNLINAGSIITFRFGIVVLAIALGLSAGLRGGAGESGWPMMIVIMTSALAAWSLFFGPQVLRQDFRRELPQMDMLKVLPLPSWQVALGQILTPVVLLTGAQWLLILVAMIFALQAGSPHLSRGLIAGVGFSSLLLFPCLNLISLIIPNAAVLLFPAWFQTGKDAPHGIEATGQRLIFALGQLLALVLSVVPAALVFAIFFFVLRFVLPLWAVVPIASLAAAIGLLITAGFGVFLLGRLFNRFDLSNEGAT